MPPLPYHENVLTLPLSHLSTYGRVAGFGGGRQTPTWRGKPVARVAGLTSTLAKGDNRVNNLVVVLSLSR